MTTNVSSVREGTGYKEIVTLMQRYRVSAVPVLDETGLAVGVVSDADLLAKAAAPALPAGAVRLAWRLRERSKATGVTAADIMTVPPVTIGPGASVSEAARLMQERHVRRLLVVTGDSRLIGVISRADVLSVFERPDPQIRDEVIRAVIAETFALDPDLFEVTVMSDVVTIAGPVSSRPAALDLLGAVRDVEGVIAVRDRLSYPAADTG
jgi:CBS domain-containing protein